MLFWFDLGVCDLWLLWFGLLSFVFPEFAPWGGVGVWLVVWVWGCCARLVLGFGGLGLVFVDLCFVCLLFYVFVIDSCCVLSCVAVYRWRLFGFVICFCFGGIDLVFCCGLWLVCLITGVGG